MAQAVEAQVRGHFGKQDAFGDPQQRGHFGKMPFGFDAFPEGGSVLDVCDDGNALEAEGATMLEVSDEGTGLLVSGSGNQLEAK